MGTLEAYRRLPLNDRLVIRKKLRDMTRALREGGTVSGSHRVDRLL